MNEKGEKTFRHKVAFVLLCALLPCALSAKILAEGPWFSCATPFADPAEAGVVRAEKDGWIVWEPSGNPGKGKDVQIRVPVPDMRFRAFNQCLAEIENENGRFKADVRLVTARPKNADLKNKREIPSGASSVEIHFPGVGMPARLREAKLVLAKETAAALTKPVRMRFRMRLTDGNFQKAFEDGVAEAMAHEPPAGLTDAERAAGDATRRKFRARLTGFARTVASASATNAERVKAYEGLMIVRENAAWWSERAALAAAAANERKRGRILHGVATGMDKIAREDAFIGSLRAPASVALARGEAEGVQIALFPDEPVKGLTWTVSPLTDATGKPAEGVALSLDPVGYVTTTDPAYIPPRQFRETAPDPILAHVKRLDLAALRFQPFFLDASASADARPGVYRGTVAFRDAAKKLHAKVPLTVTVHAFELPRHRSFPTVFSSPTFSPKNPLLDLYKKNDETLERYRRFLASDHGNISKEPADVRRLWSVARGMQRLLKDHNIPTQDIYGSVRHVEPEWLRDLQLADSPDWYCLGYDNAGPITERVAAHVEPMREKKVSKAAYLYGFDEIRLSDTRAFAGMKKDFGAVKKAFPEVRTMCTALDGSFGEKSDTKEEVDIWVRPSSGYSNPDARATAERARARGKQVWYYPCNWPYHPSANFHLENVGTASRVLTGLFPWKYKADGMLYYATAIFTVQTTSRGEHGEENEKRIPGARILPEGPVYGPEYCYSMFRSNGDGTLIYAGPDGALPSVRLKEIRDGVDDYEYLKLLDAAAGKVRAGTLKVRNEKTFLEEAEVLLLVTDDLCRGDAHYPKTGGPVLAWRARVAALLDEAAGAEARTK